MQTISNVIELMQLTLSKVLPAAKVIVDATSGNGCDTLFLAKNSRETVKLFAFDIQAAAIAATKAKTKDYAAKITYLNCSHEKIGSIITEPIDIAVFNLGYLPGAKHTITTQHESTLKAITATIKQLSLNGVCAVMVYSGHAEGAIEASYIKEYVKTLSASKYTVGCYRLINHKQTAPYLYLIERTS